MLEGASFVLLALVLDVPLRRTRRDLAGRDKARRPEDAPSDGLIVSAYWWLVIAGLLLVWEGLRPFGLLPSFWWLPAPPPDAVPLPGGGPDADG